MKKEMTRYEEEIQEDITIELAEDVEEDECLPCELGQDTPEPKELK